MLNARGGSVMTQMGAQLRWAMGRGARRRKGVVVTYNETTQSPFQMSASTLLSGDLCLKGFDMNEWLSGASVQDVKSMIDELAQLVKTDKLHLGVKKTQFSEMEKLPLTHLCPCFQTYVQTMDQ